MAKQKRRASRNPMDRLFVLIEKMLRAKGWTPAVMGPTKIEGDGRFRYRFIIEFGGTPPRVPKGEPNA